MKPGNLPARAADTVRCQVQRFFVKMRTNAHCVSALDAHFFCLRGCVVVRKNRQIPSRKEYHNDQPNFYL